MTQKVTTIFLDDGQTLLIDNKDLIVIRNNYKERFLWIEMLINVFIILFLKWIFNITIGEMFLLTMPLLIVWLLTIQRIELLFDQKNKKVVKKYSLGSMSVMNKVLLNNYEKYSYELKFDTENFVENSYSGYFLDAINKYRTVRIFSFKTQKDVEKVKSFLIESLGLSILISNEKKSYFN